MGCQALTYSRAKAAAAENIRSLEDALSEAFYAHADAAVLRSFPGLRTVLGAPRILGEIGDDRERFTTARGLKSYAGTAPAAPRPTSVCAWSAINDSTPPRTSGRFH
ncbi:transposase [Rhodococcus sp. G-MC3]|uniref:transposase n=1 Tax=Rhodococcus sp. G-MC3 TaxID=3046209 RepID=UPI0024BA9864|nr:transposase [Rhodococcus sp. G-MC3]MDJ0396518.1 transposase [Rhodococcus sp. G-MC3]